MNKNCVICQVEVKKKQSYYKVDLFEKGKLKGTDYAHKVCWFKNINQQNEVTKLLHNANKIIGNLGINKEEVIKI